MPADPFSVSDIYIRMVQAEADRDKNAERVAELERESAAKSTEIENLRSLVAVLEGGLKGRELPRVFFGTHEAWCNPDAVAKIQLKPS